MKKISETTNLIETTLCIYMESHGMVDYTDLIILCGSKIKVGRFYPKLQTCFDRVSHEGSKDFLVF